MTARERLRGLAQNATPGPWHQSELGYSVRCASGPVTNGSDRREDAAFIVAASPDVVLAMLDEIATLTARVEHYQRACITTSTEVTRVLGEALYGPTPDAWSTHTPEAIADEAASEIASLRAALTDANMRAQNWQQKAERMAARNVNPKIAAKGARHLVGIDFNLRACECDHCEDIRFVFRELAKGGRR